MISDILISVVVITYNSAKYVIETLESAKDQTYKNIELIVTDDASTDDTLTLVKQWLDANKGRFAGYKVVENKTNTGISPNCNRGIMVATGEYIKTLAGDDLLLNNCIEDLLNYSLKNNLSIAFAKVIPFIDSDNQACVTKLMVYEKLMYELFDLDVKQQYRKLLTGFGMYAHGLFVKRQFILSFGGFDVEYKMMEDYPFLIKITSMGYKLNLLDNYVVKYRVRSTDIRAEFFSSKRKKNHTSDLSRFEIKELLPRLRKERMYIAIYDLFIRKLAVKVENINSGLMFLYISKIIGYLSFSKIALRIKRIKCWLKNSAQKAGLL
ncbi:MAG TPA: glycosyltransferase [Atribacterota bacterium]|nr:glycosyltransferase [Atribacterota bacterium]